MDAAAYTSWKRGFVEAALRRAGVMAEVAEPVQVPPASRRRARFFVEQGEKAEISSIRESEIGRAPQNLSGI